MPCSSLLPRYESDTLQRKRSGFGMPTIMDDLLTPWIEDNADYTEQLQHSSCAKFGLAFGTLDRWRTDLCSSKVVSHHDRGNLRPSTISQLFSD